MEVTGLIAAALHTIGQLKARRTLGCHILRPFEREPDTSERALVEETANQRDAVGHAPRG